MTEREDKEKSSDRRIEAVSARVEDFFALFVIPDGSLAVPGLGGHRVDAALGAALEHVVDVEVVVGLLYSLSGETGHHTVLILGRVQLLSLELQGYSHKGRH